MVRGFNSDLDKERWKKVLKVRIKRKVNIERKGKMLGEKDVR